MLGTNAFRFQWGKTRFAPCRSALISRCSTIVQVTGADSGISPTSTMSTKKKQRILSGVQPTGSLHIGNYLGAIKQWVEYQQAYDSYFCVVDLHAITVPQDPKKLRKETLQSAALYIACGIDPTISKIFVQSHVPAHSELTWILNCITPMNWLERMIQYKEKAIKHGENVGVGLFDYPVLMAADILLYQPDLVPVGEDQRQHLELTRDICRRFNDQYCKRNSIVFKQPNALIVQEGARIMSLQDGTAKMSKSAESDLSRINILDSPDEIAKKFRKCKSDSFTSLEWDNPARPEATNLLSILQCVSGKSKEALQDEVRGMNWGQFKPYLSEAVVEHLRPIQEKYKEVMGDEGQLEAILKEGAEKANSVASKTLRNVKETMGFHIAN